MKYSYFPLARKIILSRNIFKSKIIKRHLPYCFCKIRIFGKTFFVDFCCLFEEFF